jgi:hypothetical protein
MEYEPSNICSIRTFSASLHAVRETGLSPWISALSHKRRLEEMAGLRFTRQGRYNRRKVQGHDIWIVPGTGKVLEDHPGFPGNFVPGITKYRL